MSLEQRQIMTEQLVRVACPSSMSAKEYRAILDEASDEDLREAWEQGIGNLVETAGI